MKPDTIDIFIQECKSRGLNITYPRMAIYKILLQFQGHPSAEDIYREVQKEHPNISLATVYKTLEMLAENDIISKVTPLHDIVRYDFNKDFHHHLVCIKCKKITDIENDSLNNLPIPKNIEKGFKVLNYQVQFDGICKDCQEL
jgi:Fur family peroxide stress response transcriptional regulator